MGTYGAHTYCSTFIIYISSNNLIPLAKHLTISRLVSQLLFRYRYKYLYLYRYTYQASFYVLIIIVGQLLLAFHWMLHGCIYWGGAVRRVMYKPSLHAID